MAARIDNGRVQLLTRTGLDWTEKYPSAIAALANLNINTAYLDGELCGAACEAERLTIRDMVEPSSDGRLASQREYATAHAFAVGRGLGMSESRQPSLIHERD
jgi:hypothetical protein